MTNDYSREYAPDFDAEERVRAQKPRHQLAKELARKLLDELQIMAPAVDVDGVARSRGLTVLRLDLDSRVSGSLYPTRREIVVNTRDRTLGRQRFTIAHELGHWELRHWQMEALPEDTLGYGGAFEGQGSSEGRSSVEVEANTFAAELLIPSKWIRRLKKPLTPDAPSELAQQYAVSQEAMFYQLMRCGRL
jgi:Zn-dependent peptidase ImmA (M78 family)